MKEASNCLSLFYHEPFLLSKARLDNIVMIDVIYLLLIYLKL